MKNIQTGGGPKTKKKQASQEKMKLSKEAAGKEKKNVTAVETEIEEKEEEQILSSQQSSTSSTSSDNVNFQNATDMPTRISRRLLERKQKKLSPEKELEANRYKAHRQKQVDEDRKILYNALSEDNPRSRTKADNASRMRDTRKQNRMLEESAEKSKEAHQKAKLEIDLIYENKISPATIAADNYDPREIPTALQLSNFEKVIKKNIFMSLSLVLFFYISLSFSFFLSPSFFFISLYLSFFLYRLLSTNALSSFFSLLLFF